VFVLSTLPAPRGTSLPFEQLMFDQDTGGAIRTAGRADLYLGVGPSAESRAGATKEEGQLYYLFLREDRL
jgi:membrane-bound lytic murein transglycosylase A